MQIALGLKITSKNPLVADVKKVYEPYSSSTGKYSICNAYCEHEGQGFLFTVYKQFDKLKSAEGKQIMIGGAIFNRLHMQKIGTSIPKCVLGLGTYEVKG